VARVGPSRSTEPARECVRKSAATITCDRRCRVASGRTEGEADSMYVAVSDDDRCTPSLRSALASGRDTDGLPHEKVGIQKRGNPPCLRPHFIRPTGGQSQRCRAQVVVYVTRCTAIDQVRAFNLTEVTMRIRLCCRRHETSERTEQDETCQPRQCGRPLKGCPTCTNHRESGTTGEYATGLPWRRSGLKREATCGSATLRCPRGPRKG